MAWNMVSHNGLAAIFHSLAITNRVLRFIDFSYNFIEVSIVHAFRQMIERNNTIKYLCVSDLHKFNSLAVESITSSLCQNSTLSMIDFR